MEVRESYLIKIDTPDPARIWSGIGNLTIPADIVEAAPATYLGAGELLSAPDFQQLINGIAERLEFTVSGITEETLRLARDEAPDVKGAMMYVGRVDFDDEWQIIAVEWEAVFRCDTLTVDSQGQGGKRVRTIMLSVGTDDTGRSYAPSSYFTDADQKLRSPTDTVFSLVSSITRGKSRVFGPRYVEPSGGLF